MNEEEKESIEEFRKQLRLAINIDDVTTAIRNDNAQTILNLIDKMKNCINILDDELKERNKTINEKEIIIEKLQKENEELSESNKKLYEIGQEMCKQDKYTSENYISVQKVKDKIEKEIKYHEKNILDIENITMLKDKTVKEEAEIEFNKYAIVVLKKMLQELLEGRKNEI